MTELLKKYWRFILSAAAILALLAIAWTWWGAFVPFIIGLVLAYLMLPGVNWMEKNLPPKNKWPKAKRIISIFIVFLLALVLLSLFLSFIIITVIQTFIDLFSRAPEFIENLMNWVQEWAEGFQAQLPPGLQAQVEQLITNLGLQMEGILQNIVTQGFSFITGTFGALMGLIALPLFLFYLLKDYKKIKRGLYSTLPSWAIEHAGNVGTIIEKIFGHHIRASLILGGLVAVLSFAGLTILGVPYAAALAFFAGFVEFIPVIGPWFGALAAILVTLGFVPNSLVFVVILFLGIQLLKTRVIGPRVKCKFTQMHPVAILLLLVLGAYFAGIWGLILAVPFAATIGQIIEYWKSRKVVPEENPETVDGSNLATTENSG